MRGKALGYGVVLVLVIASIALQMSLPPSDGSRFATIVLQAATLVAAVRASSVHRGAPASRRSWRSRRLSPP